MIRPTDPYLPLRSEDEIRRVDAMRPVAPDGRDFAARVEALALYLAPLAGDELRPSTLRARAKAEGIEPPREQRQTAWGQVWASLRRTHFDRTERTETSPTPSRNAVREVVYVRRGGA